MKEFYQMNQQEQLKSAEHSYIIPLKDTVQSSIYTVCLALKGEHTLRCLCPHAVDEGHLLPSQVKNENNLNYPAYYFRISDMKINRMNKMKAILCDINRKLHVMYLRDGVVSDC